MNTENLTSTEKNKVSRSFRVKLSKDGELYGRYNGDSPYQAANKALSEIIRKKLKDIEGGGKNKSENITEPIYFYLVESTKGSQKKEDAYYCTRIKLDSPIEYKVNDTQIITKAYKNILRKIKTNRVNTDKNIL